MGSEMELANRWLASGRADDQERQIEKNETKPIAKMAGKQGVNGQRLTPFRP